MTEASQLSSSKLACQLIGPWFNFSSCDGDLKLSYPYTVVSKIIRPPGFSLLDPMVNKSCNIELCGNKMHQIVAYMT